MNWFSIVGVKSAKATHATYGNVHVVYFDITDENGTKTTITFHPANPTKKGLEKLVKELRSIKKNALYK